MVEVINCEMRLPRINEKYIMSRYSRRLVLSEAYRQGKAALLAVCKSAVIPPPFGVRIDVETYADLDSCAKVILDVVAEKIGVNDRECVRLIIKKKPGKRGHDDKVSVYVWSENHDG